MDKITEYDEYRKNELLSLVSNISMKKLDLYIIDENNTKLYEKVREALFLCAEDTNDSEKRGKE